MPQVGARPRTWSGGHLGRSTLPTTQAVYHRRNAQATTEQCSANDKGIMKAQDKRIASRTLLSSALYSPCVDTGQGDFRQNRQQPLILLELKRNRGVRGATQAETGRCARELPVGRLAAQSSIHQRGAKDNMDGERREGDTNCHR